MGWGRGVKILSLLSAVVARDAASVASCHSARAPVSVVSACVVRGCEDVLTVATMWSDRLAHRVSRWFTSDRRPPRREFYWFINTFIKYMF